MNISAFSCYAIAVIAAVSPAASLRAQDDPAASRVLKECLHTQEQLSRFQLQCETKVDRKYPKGAFGDNELFQTGTKCSWRRDGGRYEVLGTYFWTTRDPEQFRLIYDGNRVLGYQLPLGSRHRLGSLFPDVAKISFILLATPLFGGPLDGYLTSMGDALLCRVVLESEKGTLAPDKVVEGVPCKVVHASTSHGEVTLWIGSEFHRIVAFEVRKKPSDLNGGKASNRTLGDSKVFDLPMRSWSASLMNRKFVKVNGIPIASEGDLRLESQAIDGKTLLETFSCLRTNIQVNPPSFDAGAFELDMEDGATMSEIGKAAKSGIRLIWKKNAHGGDVVLADSAIRSGPTPFHPQRGSHATDWWLFALSGGALIVVLILWRWRRQA